VTVDGTTVHSKSHTWNGSSNTHVISYPKELSPGDHTVVFTATWSTQGSNPSSFTVRVHCEAPPAPPVHYGCDGKVVDAQHPAATCTPPAPPVQVSIPATPPAAKPVREVCLSKGTLVLYTKRSTILRQRAYVNGKLVADSRPNANSHRQRFALPANIGPEYKLRIVAKLRNQKYGHVFSWTKTVKVKRCGIAPARARHIDP
jgi:hypothetical protein